MGFSLPILKMTGSEKEHEQDAVRQTPKSKPLSKRTRWRNKRTQRRLNFATGEFERKSFEDYTVGELKKIVENPDVKEAAIVPTERESIPEISNCSPITPIGTSSCCGIGVEPLWFDEYHLSPLYEDIDEGKPEANLLGLNCRSDAEEFEKEMWVKVDSVMDSGASAPVAPPSMAPNAPTRDSPGSLRTK